MKRQAPKSNKSQQYCCVAVGSRDRSLSVWMTALQRPLVVIHDLFEDSILDLSWSSHGYILLACSVDGTVVSLQFSANELGTPLTEDDKNSLYQRMYGKSANFDMNAQASKEMIIENVELLDVTNDKPKPPVFPLIAEQIQKPQSIAITTSNTANNVELQNGDCSSINAPQTPTKPISKQIETRTADGKRRITPMFIPLCTDDPAPEFSSSSRSTTNIVIETVNSNSHQNDASSANSKDTLVEPMIVETQKEATNHFTTTDNNDTRQLDTRLSKPAPISSQIVKESNGNVMEQEKPQTPAKSDQISYVTKPLAQSGGKAVPLKGSFIKSAGGELRVQVFIKFNILKVF